MRTPQVLLRTCLLGTGLSLSFGCGSSDSSARDTSAPQTTEEMTEQIDDAPNGGRPTEEERGTDAPGPAPGDPAEGDDRGDASARDDGPTLDDEQDSDGSALPALSDDANAPDGSAHQGSPDDPDVADAAPRGPSAADAGPAKLAKSHDPCRQPEECTNGGDVNDVWNVMTCFAPWQPRPIGVDPGPGCENQGCADGFRCRSDGLCEPITCETTEDCAADFACTAEGTCKRLSCTTDDDCDAYCVNGACSQGLGICDYQTAA